MKNFLFCVWIIAALGLSGVSHTIYSADSATDAATKAAQAWLALVDSGEYAESWQKAAQIFRSQVTKDQWVNALNSVRSPLGKVESRTLKNSTYTKSLPGAPDGEYVVIQFDTVFEKRKSSIETITPMKERDGQWRVSGYFIK